MDRSVDTGHDRGKQAQQETHAAVQDVLEAAEQECLARYGTLILRPHPVSDHHPRASMAQRAAQFSPFAALSGYDEAIRRTAEEQQSRMERTEGRKDGAVDPAPPSI